MYQRPMTPVEKFKMMVAEERYKEKERIKRAKFITKLLEAQSKQLAKIARS